MAIFGVSGDFSVHDPVNHLEIATNMLDKLLLSDSQGNEEFLPEDFPWRGWFALYSDH